MAIKAIIDKLDDAPDALREHYRAGTADEGAEGKFVLGVEAVGGWALEDVSGLKTTFGKEMTERKRLEKELAKFKDIDPDKAREALTKYEELGNLDPAKEADRLVKEKLDAATKQLVEKHGAELSQREQRIQFLSGAVDNYLRRQEAVAAIAEAKGSVDLLLPHVLGHTRTVEEDGKFRLEVVDKDGNPRIADGKGTPMDLTGLVAEMRSSDTFARAFDGDGHTGTGKEHDKGDKGGHVKGDPGGSREERRQYFASKLKLPT